ncbi:transporter [Escherichia coli]|nr:transporter [Escherichia coli]PNS26735.1 transporter [Escherichia coli]TKK56694.1 transporter [Escherichia coli]
MMSGNVTTAGDMNVMPGGGHCVSLKPLSAATWRMAARFK